MNVLKQHYDNGIASWIAMSCLFLLFAETSESLLRTGEGMHLAFPKGGLLLVQKLPLVLQLFLVVAMLFLQRFKLGLQLHNICTHSITFKVGSLVFNGTFGTNRLHWTLWTL